MLAARSGITRVYNTGHATATRATLTVAIAASIRTVALATKVTLRRPLSTSVAIKPKLGEEYANKSPPPFHDLVQLQRQSCDLFADKHVFGM